jgi:hypothetical protein
MNGDMNDKYIILVEKSQGKKVLGRSRDRQQDTELETEIF